MFAPYISPSELYHYGIKGMKWGVRRYQNSDGTLTDAGRERYRKGKTPIHYESARTRKYEKKYGTNSYEYRKSAELDELLAQRYRQDAGTPLGIAKSVGKYIATGGASQQKTYEMSRATGRGVVESYIRSKLDISPAVLLSVATGTVAANLVRNVEASGKLASAISQISNGPLKNILKQPVSNAGDAVKALKDAGGIVVGGATGVPKVVTKSIGSAPIVIGGGSASGKIAERMAADAQKILANPNRGKEFSKMMGTRIADSITPEKVTNAMLPAGRTKAQVVAGSLAGQVANIVPSNRGHEWSLQQQWLRSNYIRRGKKK